MPAMLIAAAPTAFAQRASENPTASAADAFGTRVGNENIGLYNPNNARGFSPAQAGNERIEGLYFDQQGNLGVRIARSTTMRIGLAAQSYPFPAPTGIADIGLRIPGKATVVSPAVQFDVPTGMRLASVDMQTPIIVDRLALSAGTGVFSSINDYRGTNLGGNIGALFQWTPQDNVEILPFVVAMKNTDGEQQPLLYTAGAYLPPKYARNIFFGQDWAERNSHELNFGVVARATVWSNWRLQAGLFRSTQTITESHLVFFRNVQPSGAATLDILKYPEHSSASTSGEVRASGVFADGSWRHTVHVATRARISDRIFGGGNTVSFGPTLIGQYRAVPEPAFVFGVRDEDKVDQYTPGISYIGQWANVGEFSVGLQKSFYHRTIGKVGLPTTATTKSQPWLYNGTLAVYPSPSLSFYGSYTRGLEEFGNAPEDVVNRGEPLPAAGTKQIDAGLRYRITPALSLVAGVFEVSKPYFERDLANVYTDVGALSHQGIEVSLTGQPIQGLRVVAGALFLKARITGLPVDQGLIGEISPGTPPRTILLNVQYGAPSWHGITVDADVNFRGSMIANRANTLRVPTRATLAVGVRMPFEVLNAKANLRLQVENVTNAYGWNVAGSSGRYSPGGGREFKSRIVADF